MLSHGTGNKSITLRRDTGKVIVSSDSTSGSVFEGQLNQSTTSSINANGSAEFSAKVETIGDNAAFHVGTDKNANKVPFNIYDTADGNAVLARINGDGSATFADKVGIGTTSPSHPLEVRGVNTQINFSSSGTGGGYLMSTNSGQWGISGGVRWNGAGWYTRHTSSSIIRDDGDANIRFFTNTSNTVGAYINPAERMRVDSSGRLLVGTTSSSVHFAAIFQGNSSGTAPGVMCLAFDSNAPADNAMLGSLDFSDNNHVRAARIECNRDGGTWTSGGGGSQPSRLVFRTTADGESSPNERMRINKAGNVTIKTAKKGVFSDGTFTLANDATTTFDIGYAAFFVLTVTNCSEVTNGTSGAFFANSASSTIAEISDPFGDFTANNNVANTTGVTKTTNSSTITIRNDYGASATYRVAIFGTSSS